MVGRQSEGGSGGGAHSFVKQRSNHKPRAWSNKVKPRSNQGLHLKQLTRLHCNLERTTRTRTRTRKGFFLALLQTHWFPFLYRCGRNRFWSSATRTRTVKSKFKSGLLLSTMLFGTQNKASPQHSIAQVCTCRYV
jgi:hypothetical protein